jgi:hypothetical protein
MIGFYELIVGSTALELFGAPIPPQGPFGWSSFCVSGNRSVRVCDSSDRKRKPDQTRRQAKKQPNREMPGFTEVSGKGQFEGSSLDF